MKNLKQFVIATFLIVFSFIASAENYPYRSDVLWVTVPNHANWLYKTGEKAIIVVEFYKYGIPQDGITVKYELGGDLMPSDKYGKVILKNGRATINIGTMKTPGFKDCRLTVTIGDKTYKHHVKIGFSPEKLQPYTKMPADFKQFWQNNIDEMEKVPLYYTRQYIEKYSDDSVDCYLIHLKIDNLGHWIYGYLFYPKNKTHCPVVFTPPGAGIKEIRHPLLHIYYPKNGFIRFEIDIHGLNPELGDENFKEISDAFNSRDNGYLSNGIDSRDNYYMKHVYLACLRSIDFLTSLPQWDGKNVIVQGGSQGGGLALVTAGLDRRITACVVNHPALADMAGYLDNRAGGYPHFFSKMRDMDKPDKLNTMQYYDAVNFAKLITVPTFMTWGYNDNTCPPTTSYIVYNVLTCPKEALLTPINEHWTSNDTDYAQMLWIKKHLK